jgi:putative heme-binding domain-containing protein
LALEDRHAEPAVIAELERMAAVDESPRVRLYLASALQRLPHDQRWQIAHNLLSHAADSNDHNLPLIIWYGVEPLAAASPKRALEMARQSKLPQVTRYLVRRVAGNEEHLPAVTAAIAAATDEKTQSLLLQETLNALRGRADVKQPSSWQTAYAKLAGIANEEIHRQADELALIFGDRRVLPRMREILADPNAPTPRRVKALATLVNGRDEKAVPLLHNILAEADLRGPALRALANFDDERTPEQILSRYGTFADTEKRDAVQTLTSRANYARAMLVAVNEGKLPRTDIHAFHIRQLLRFDDAALKQQVTDVWGAIRSTSADKKVRIEQLKADLAPDRLAAGDRGNGRRLFDKNCATCHRLFGEGSAVGPELTGSNRANLDYVLENIVAPNAVVGMDYRLTEFELEDGRIVSGLIQLETDNVLTIKTVNDTIIVPTKDVGSRRILEQSMMPEGLLDDLDKAEIRDLVAYVASPIQVTPRGPAAPIDVKTGKVPQAVEGESLAVIKRTAGEVSPQGMGGFKNDRWSGNSHLWWTPREPSARLDLKLPVAKSGDYDIEIVMTKARDYGIVQLSLDEQSLGGPIDLFNAPDVVTTGVQTFVNHSLTAGDHVLSVDIVGANPQAIKSYMFGLDYVKLTPAETAEP